MATELAKLVVKLEAESSKLTKELKKSNRQAAAWAKKTKRSVALVKKAFIGLGITVAAIKFTSFINNSIKTVDNIGKMSDALGLSTKAFQEYSFGADIAGVSQSQLTSNLTAFVKRVGEARAETGPLVSFLKKYDTELLKNIQSSRDQEHALGLVADAIKKAKTATDRAAIANAAFSRAGVTMTNFLRDGQKGIEAYAAEANKLGLVIDEAMVRNTEAANDKITKLTSAIGVKTTSLVASYAKEIGNAADSILGLMKAAAEAPKFIRFLSESLASAIGGPADPVRIADRIFILQKRINDLTGVLDEIKHRKGFEGVVHLALFGSGSQTKEDLAAAQKEMAKLLSMQKLFGGAANDPAPTIASSTSDQEITDKEELSIVILDMEFALQDKLLAVRAQKAKQYAQIQKNVEAQVTMFRENSANHAIGFLSLLGQKSKVFAAAAIIAEKVMAITRIRISTQVAAAAALTPPPIGLGPVAGQGLAASIRASGLASSLFVGGTGLLQLANLNSGSAPSISGSGGGVQSVSNVDPVTGETIRQGTSQQTIILIGLSEAEMDSVLDRAEVQINEGSRTIIRRDSPQAQEILAGAAA